MTRKDYILIARALKDARMLYGSYQYQKEAWQTAVEFAALLIADRLTDDNPRFSRTHFLLVIRGEKPLESRPPR